MSETSINIHKANSIIKYGKLYNPAHSHYPHLIHDQIQKNIICYFCNKPNLKICIGFNSDDLCLTCADSIVTLQNNIQKT